MRSLRAIALTAVLTVSASLLVAPPAFARPTWVPPAKLGAEARYFDMDINSAGAAVSAWFRDDALKVSYRPAGRDWSRPVVLARGMLGGTYTNTIPVRAFVDARGRAAVVAYVGGDGTGIFTKKARGPWRADDHPVGGGGIWSSFPTADMDAAGNLVLTWVESDDFSGDDESIFWRKPSGDWSFQSGGGGGNYDLVAHNGTATIARNGNGSADDEGLYVQTSRIGERSVTPWRNLRPGAHIGYTPIIEGNARGDLVLVAVEGENDSSKVLYNAGPGRLVVMTKAAGKDWVDASAAAPQTDIGHPAVEIGRDGQIVVTYRRSSDGELGVVAGQVGEAALTAPVVLAETSGKSPASAAISPAGEVLVTWSTAKGSVRVAKRSTAGKWTSLGRLRGDTLGGHLVRAYPNGMFTALHLDAGALWWSDYVDDSTGPRTVMRAPRHHTSTSRSITVRWHMTDALSRPASADVRVRSGRPGGRLGAWTVWKRQTTTEKATFHGRPARRYCFSARGHDRLGNTGRWSENRCTTTPRS